MLMKYACSAFSVIKKSSFVQQEELSYLQQRLGLRCLTSTLFEDAGNRLFRGKLDPRILIDLFPDLIGTTLDNSSDIRIFAGIREHLPTTSVDEISEFFWYKYLLLPSCLPQPPLIPLPLSGTKVLENLVRNYSPHLPPNTRSAPPTAELRKIRNEDARNMLQEYLRKWRNLRQYREVEVESTDIDRVGSARSFHLFDSLIICKGRRYSASKTTRREGTDRRPTFSR